MDLFSGSSRAELSLGERERWGIWIRDGRTQLMGSSIPSLRIRGCFYPSSKAFLVDLSREIAEKNAASLKQV